MNLGCFSVSLAVTDIARSRAFYEALGFVVIDGAASKNWVVLRNGTTTIGLFRGMFESNILTFNPPDARAAERALWAAGFDIDKPAKGDRGVCHVRVLDPDGNVILLDQSE